MSYLEMLIPYNSDTLLYHWPIATVSSIVFTIVVSIAFWMAPATTQESMVLLHGDGLHPTQWVTSIFVHGGIMHLVGNMIFLWAFGLIVEGKAGPWRFLMLFLGIGVGQCLVEQVMMLGADNGGSLGASAAIFGLLALAVVWAPYNEMDTVLFIWFYPITFELQVMTFGFLYFALQVIGWGMAGMGLSSEALHLMGLVPGFAIGWSMAARGRVDCDGHDLPSIYGGREGQPLPGPAKEPAPKRHPQAVTSEQPAASVRLREQRLSDARGQVTRFLEDGNVDAAERLMRKLRAEDPSQQLDARELKLAVRHRLKGQQWSAAKQLLTEHLNRFSDSRDSLRLQLAKIIVLVEQRPAAGLRLLKQIDRGQLNAAARETFRQLAVKAKQSRQGGAVELRDETDGI